MPRHRSRGSVDFAKPTHSQPMPRQENRDGVIGATISNAPAPPVECRDGVLEASWLLRRVSSKPGTGQLENFFAKWKPPSDKLNAVSPFRRQHFIFRRVFADTPCDASVRLAIFQLCARQSIYGVAGVSSCATTNCEGLSSKHCTTNAAMIWSTSIRNSAHCPYRIALLRAS